MRIPKIRMQTHARIEKFEQVPRHPMFDHKYPQNRLKKIKLKAWTLTSLRTIASMIGKNGTPPQIKSTTSSRQPDRNIPLNTLKERQGNDYRARAKVVNTSATYLNWNSNPTLSVHLVIKKTNNIDHILSECPTKVQCIHQNCAQMYLRGKHLNTGAT